MRAGPSTSPLELGADDGGSGDGEPGVGVVGVVGVVGMVGVVVGGDVVVVAPSRRLESSVRDVVDECSAGRSWRAPPSWDRVLRRSLGADDGYEGDAVVAPGPAGQTRAGPSSVVRALPSPSALSRSISVPVSVAAPMAKAIAPVANARHQSGRARSRATARRCSAGRRSNSSNTATSTGVNAALGTVPGAQRACTATAAAAEEAAAISRALGDSRSDCIPGRD